MYRIAGYMLKIDTTLLSGHKIPTKAGAIAEAKVFLKLRKAKKVGIVRYNDKLLLMTIEINKDNTFTTYIK